VILLFHKMALLAGRLQGAQLLAPSYSQRSFKGAFKSASPASRHVAYAAAVSDADILLQEELEAAKRAAAQANVKREKARSKRFKAMEAKIGGRNRTVEAEPMEAIKLIRGTASTKFTESVEVHARMGLDPKFSDQQLRATVSLPKGTGKELRVAVLTQGENLNAAKAAGADVFGADDLVEKISGVSCATASFPQHQPSLPPATHWCSPLAYVHRGSWSSTS
jgi:large subunit ribosomal protein L1